jgi:hypothetical protein
MWLDIHKYIDKNSPLFQKNFHLHIIQYYDHVTGTYHSNNRLVLAVNEHHSKGCMQNMCTTLAFLQYINR